MLRVPKIPAKIKTVLKLAGDLLPLVPGKNDSKMQIALKVVAVADVLQKNLYTKECELTALVKEHDLIEITNEQFVALFFETEIKTQFQIRSFTLEDTSEQVIEAYSPKYGRLFFTQWQRSPRPADKFYHSKDFNFPDILESVWDTYDGRLHISVTYSSNVGSQSVSTFSSFGELRNPLYGPMQDQMDRLVARHRRWLLDGIARTYMFYGQPGTGKTSFALAFADRLGNRLLKIDAKSFSYMMAKDLTFICNALKPEFLLIDEIDKADIMTTLPTILDILQNFKVDHVGTSIILTANTIEGFDEGFLRPGRVDTWVEFLPPDAHERSIILEKYLQEQEGLHVPDYLFNNVIEKTEGLTQDYIRELALMLKYESTDEILRTIHTWKLMLSHPHPDMKLTPHPNPNVKPAGV